MSTPRTDEVETANKFPASKEYYEIVVHARTLERELAALTSERDQLRAENKRLRRAYVWTDDIRAQLELVTARAEAAETVALAKWNGAFERALKAEAERDHLQAQLRALTLICGTNDANKFETWIDRANARAERAEAELATERARLDSGQILLTVAGERVWHCGVDLRAAIDAAMKEDAK